MLFQSCPPSSTPSARCLHYPPPHSPPTNAASSVPYMTPSTPTALYHPTHYPQSPPLADGSVSPHHTSPTTEFCHDAHTASSTHHPPTAHGSDGALTAPLSYSSPSVRLIPPIPPPPTHTKKKSRAHQRSPNSPQILTSLT